VTTVECSSGCVFYGAASVSKTNRYTIVSSVCISARCVQTFVLVQIALSVSCAGRVAQTTWSYDEHVGVVSAVADKLCYVTKAPSLAAKTAVQVVDPGLQQQRQATVVAAAEGCLYGSGQSLGLRGYTIQFEGAPPQLPFYGIGVVDAVGQFRRADGSMVADVDGDRHNEFFRFCTSAEGVHFTIWTDAALIGSRRWHQYQPLGYDVSPTCTPAEAAGS
jgi:hypothetical protein